MVDGGGLELGGQLALLIMVSFVGVFCCVRNCNQNGRFGRAAMLARRRFPLDERGRQRRGASQARVRELRQQLAEIPDERQERVPQAAGPASPTAQPTSSSAAASLEVDQGSSGAISLQDVSRWTS